MRDLMFTSNSIKNLVVFEKRGKSKGGEKTIFFLPAAAAFAGWVQSMYKEFTQVKFERIYRLDLWHRLHSHEREVYKWDFKSLIPRAWTKRKKEEKKVKL